jgi:hypothetical protein
MKTHILWILFWLHACGLAQSQAQPNCTLRTLSLPGPQNSILIADGMKEVLVSVNRGVHLTGVVSGPQGPERANQRAIVKIHWGSDDQDAQHHVRTLNVGDRSFITARFINLDISRRETEPVPDRVDATIEYCLVG